MSDLIAPVDEQKQATTTLTDILTLLFDIRMELRILNTLIVDGLNSDTDPDELRQDPYYNGSGDQETDPGITTR